MTPFIILMATKKEPPEVVRKPTTGGSSMLKFSSVRSCCHREPLYIGGSISEYILHYFLGKMFSLGIQHLGLTTERFFCD